MSAAEKAITSYKYLPTVNKHFFQPAGPVLQLLQSCIQPSITDEKPFLFFFSENKISSWQLLLLLVKMGRKANVTNIAQGETAILFQPSILF